MISANNTNNRKKTKEIQKIRDKYKRHTTHDRENTTDVEIIDTLKQKLSAYTSRLNIYIYKKATEEKMTKLSQ